MNNVLTLPFLTNNGYPSPPISDPSLSRQYDFNDRDAFYDVPLSSELLDSDFERLTAQQDDRGKSRGESRLGGTRRDRKCVASLLT